MDGSGTGWIEGELSADITGVGGSSGIMGWSISVFWRDASIISTPDDSVNGVGGSGVNVNMSLLVARDASNDKDWDSEICPCAQSEVVDASITSAIDSTLMDLEWTGFMTLASLFIQ